jgi:hypothetical protein
MKTLWVFGDSYSALFDSKEIEKWSNVYSNWKGYTPKTFGNLISEKYDIKLNNLAKGGIDNDTMYEMICENVPLIQNDDIIIIGWSNVLRYRLGGINNEWVTIIPNYDTNLDTLSNISKKTLDEVLYNRSSSLYREEYVSRRNFLNWLFKDNPIIHWTPFTEQYSYILGFTNIETIGEETREQVKDGHYSENGHVELSKQFINLLENDKLRYDFNNMKFIKNKLL